MSIHKPNKDCNKLIIIKTRENDITIQNYKITTHILYKHYSVKLCFYVLRVFHCYVLMSFVMGGDIFYIIIYIIIMCVKFYCCLVH